MQNSRERNPAFQQRTQLLPGLLATLTATIQTSSPQPTQAMPEGTELIHISGDSMVLVVALNDLRQPFTNLRCRRVLPADQFCFYDAQLRHHPLCRRLRQTMKLPSLRRFPQ
jgi:hypothetical protein